MDPEKKPDGVIKAGAKSIRWTVPDGVLPWQLGEKSHWPILERFLDMSGADDFCVDDEASETSLAEVQKLFDTSHDSARWGVVHMFVGNTGGDNAGLLERLLALGIDPDLEGPHGYRPSHFSGFWAREECAKVISLCRPSLTAKNSEGRTPRDAAAMTYRDEPSRSPELRECELKLRRPEVLKVWEKLEESGFPSLARMASERQSWAVKNLSRRRLVPRDEILEKYCGKTAIEWALAFGETQLAQELRYLFRGVLLEEQVKRDVDALSTKVNEIDKSVGQLRGDLKRVSDSSATSAVTAVADARAEAAEQQSVVTASLLQLRTELTSLRDHMQEEKKKVTSLCEDIQEEKKKVTAKLEAVEADVQEIKGGSPQSADSINGSAASTGNTYTSFQVRRKNGGKVAERDGHAAAAHPLAAYFAKRVEAVARITQQSLEFFTDLAEVLDEYETIDQ